VDGPAVVVVLEFVAGVSLLSPFTVVTGVFVVVAPGLRPDFAEDAPAGFLVVLLVTVAGTLAVVLMGLLELADDVSAGLEVECSLLLVTVAALVTVVLLLELAESVSADLEVV